MILEKRVQVFSLCANPKRYRLLTEFFDDTDFLQWFFKTENPYRAYFPCSSLALRIDFSYDNTIHPFPFDKDCFYHSSGLLRGGLARTDIFPPPLNRVLTLSN